jgi:hypothetical protein
VYSDTSSSYFLSLSETEDGLLMMELVESEILPELSENEQPAVIKGRARITALKHFRLYRPEWMFIIIFRLKSRVRMILSIEDRLFGQNDRLARIGDIMQDWTPERGVTIQSTLIVPTPD